MRPRRTIRKPTRWTPDEWARVEDAARTRGVPPLRFVREAALGAPPAPAPQRARRARDELVKQIGRVLNNLRQLQTIAELNWDRLAAARIALTAKAAEAAIRTAPPPGTNTAAAVRAIIDAGRALNELARIANTDEELPADAELLAALEAVDSAFTGIGR